VDFMHLEKKEKVPIPAIKVDHAIDQKSERLTTTPGSLPSR